MILMRAMAEIQAEHIGAGHEQSAQLFRRIAGGADGGNDFGVTMTAHFRKRTSRGSYAAMMEPTIALVDETFNDNAVRDRKLLGRPKMSDFWPLFDEGDVMVDQ
jgi:hypothetical protein